MRGHANDSAHGYPKASWLHRPGICAELRRTLPSKWFAGVVCIRDSSAAKAAPPGDVAEYIV